MLVLTAVAGCVSMRAWEQPHSSFDHFLVLKFPLGSAQIMNDPCLYDDDADDFQTPPFELAGQRHQHVQLYLAMYLELQL